MASPIPVILAGGAILAAVGSVLADRGRAIRRRQGEGPSVELPGVDAGERQRQGSSKGGAQSGKRETKDSARGGKETPRSAGGSSGSGGGAIPADWREGNFSLAELAVSARRGDLVEPVPAELRPNAVRLIREVLQPCRNWLRAPLYVTSGYRSPALNNAVDGDDNSQHMNATAADMTTRNLATNRGLFLAILGGQVRGLRAGQVIFYPAQNFIHLALPGATYRSVTCQVHNPARGHRLVRVTSAAHLSQLGY